MSHLFTARRQTAIVTAIVVLLAPLGVGVLSPSAEAATTCALNKNVRMRIEFTRVANVNAGNALPQVELANGQTVAGGTTIDLVRNGKAISDPGDPAGRGINVKRTPGTLAFRFHGLAKDFVTRETMHGRIILEGGHFTGFTNGSPTRDPLERQGDGTYDEDAGNDEVAFVPNATVVPFFSTVSTGSDNFTLRYVPNTVCKTTPKVSPAPRMGRGNINRNTNNNTNKNVNNNSNINSNVNNNTNNVNLNINNSSNNSSDNNSDNNNTVYIKQEVR